MSSLITLDSVRASCPSIFAARPSPKVSEKYAFISTAELIAPLLRNGWLISDAKQRRTRKGGRDPQFTRHSVRLRRNDVKPFVGDVFPEVIITNSHDRQSRFQVHSGLFRLACSNGLVVAMGLNTESMITHIGNQDRIQELIETSLKTAQSSLKIVETMMSRKIDAKKQLQFATKAVELTYGKDDQRFDPSLLLAPRRDADKGDQLWLVYNRVQENLIQGKVEYQSAERRGHTNPITHIGRSIAVNRDLWELAMGFLPKTVSKKH